jgi:hypothetical protein
VSIGHQWKNHWHEKAKTLEKFTSIYLRQLRQESGALPHVTVLHNSLPCIIIIINHWHDSPLWALTFLRIIHHSSLFSATLLHFFTPRILMSWHTHSSHLSFGLPTFLVPSGLVLHCLVYYHITDRLCSCIYRWNANIKHSASSWQYMSAHRCLCTSLLAHFTWKLSDYHPHSPDLSLSDYSLFTYLNNWF